MHKKHKLIFQFLCVLLLAYGGLGQREWDVLQTCYVNGEGECVGCKGAENMKYGLKEENGKLVQYRYGCVGSRDREHMHGWKYGYENTMYKMSNHYIYIYIYIYIACPNPSHIWSQIREENGSMDYGCVPECPAAFKSSIPLPPSFEKNSELAICAFKSQEEFYKAWGNRVFPHESPMNIYGEHALRRKKTNKMGVDENGIFYVQESLFKTYNEDGFYTHKVRVIDQVLNTEVVVSVAEHPLSCLSTPQGTKYITHVYDNGRILQGECILAEIFPEGKCPGKMAVHVYQGKEAKSCRISKEQAKLYLGRHQENEWCLDNPYGPCICAQDLGAFRTKMYRVSPGYLGKGDYLYSCNYEEHGLDFWNLQESAICRLKGIREQECHMIDQSILYTLYIYIYI